MEPTQGDWQRREDLLDSLLELPAAERAAFVERIAKQSPQDALALRNWLAGIERSADYLQPNEPPVAIGHDAERVGNWRVLRLIGRGGMGEVWLGERADGLFEKKVAIKFIRDDRPQLRNSIESERRMLAGLEHPGIVRLLDAGATGAGHPFLVTDFIDGSTLDAWLDQHRPSLSQRLDLFRQIAEAVAYAHDRLIVHRDIKPSNVLIDTNAQAHLLDFGIARALANHGDAAHTTNLALTPEYAAPELIVDNSASVRSDIYALGGLLYFLLCGKPPLAVRGMPLAATVEKICHELPMPPSAAAAPRLGAASKRLIADLDAIALKALAKAPRERYATVESMLQDVDAAQGSRPILARAPDFRDRAQRYLRRHAIAIAIAAVVAASLLLGMAGTLWQAHQAQRQRERAESEAARARAEAQAATSVRDFLVDVFRSANPEETLGKTPTAVDLLDGGAQQAEHGLQDQPALQTQLFDALGNAYTGLGRYDRAKALLGKGRQIAVAAFGVDSLPAQRLAVDFAKAVRFGQGPYDEARAMLAEIVAHDSHASAEADALTIAAMVESGAIERNTGNLDAAEVDLRGAVARARELGKSGEATLLEALSQFAEFADAKGRRAEAIDTFREVIAIGLRQTTPASAQVAAARRELATLLGQSGKNDEAESILREVVAANRDLYGIAHPAYLTSLIELARALIRKPAFAEAEALLDEALATARSHFGEDNEATAQAEVTLGALKYAQSDIAKAIDLDQQALRYCVAHDGDNSSRVWLLRQNLARMQVDNGQYAAAESGLRELLAGLSRIHSDQTGDALELLGDLRRYQGDAASAMQLHQQALDVLRKNGDEHSFDVQELKLALAQDARDLNRFDLARNDAEAGRDGLIALHQDANAKMIVFARYAVAQIDTLQGHCAASLPALEAMWEQNKSRGDTPMLRWKTAQSGLFVGLCRKQLRAADTAATHALIATNAAILRNSALADPYMKHLAVVALHAN